MRGSVFDLPAYRPLPLLLCLVFSALIFASWLYIPLTQSWLHSADATIFGTLNGTLEGRPIWQHYWAIANNHFFDFLSILLMLWLSFSYVVADERRYLGERVAVMLSIATIIAIASLTTNIMDNGHRASPTAAVDGAFRLSEHVTWLTTKDISYNSYPSDHATVLLMMTWLLWYFAGRRNGVIMLAAAVFFASPRLIGGAHWFTDMFAGALPLVLAVVGIFLFTPLKHMLVRLWMRLWSVPFFATLLDIGTHPQAPLLVAKGCCMGAADIVPGVSGGTMAYILGIWHRLIEAIKSFDLAWFKLLLSFKLTAALRHAHLHFVLPLVLGIALSVVTFTTFIPIPVILQTYPEPIYGLFFGLIAGSIVLLLMELGGQNLKDLCILALGVAAGWLLVNVVPVDTPETPWFVFLCGCIAISAMLLPGISGSFILLILGKYAYILGGIGALDFAIILPFLAGCATGLIAFSRAASWLLSHHHRASVLTITGILIGSLWMIWPFQHRVYAMVREKERLVGATPYWPEQLNDTGEIALALMVFGLLLVWQLGRMAARKQIVAAERHPAVEG